MSLRARFAAREPLTQSLAYLAAMQDRGWATVLVGGTVMLIRPRPDGAFGRLQRPRAVDLGHLDLVAERTDLRHIVIEPAIHCDVTGRDGELDALRFDADGSVSLAHHGFARAEPLAHTKTAVVDLAGGFDATLARWSGTARRNARIAARHGDVSYRRILGHELTDATASELHSLYAAFLEGRPWLDDDWDVKAAILRRFPHRGAFITASSGDALLGAVLVLAHDRVVSYFAAFSTDEAREPRVPTGLVVETVRFGLEHECDLLDFVGIWDDRVPDRYPRWKGFSAFKLRFGAEPITLPWAYELRRKDAGV